MKNLKRIIENSTNASHLNAHICVVHCIDPRFEKTHDLFKKKYEVVDPIVLAGGAKHLVNSNDPGHQFVLDQILISIKLHNTPEVALMVHENCGAYKGCIPDDANEHEFLADDLGNAKNNVSDYLKKNEFGHVKVNTYIVDFDGIAHVNHEELVVV